MYFCRVVLRALTYTKPVQWLLNKKHRRLNVYKNEFGSAAVFNIIFWFSVGERIVKEKSLSEISFLVFFSDIMEYGSDSNGDIDSMRG
jgi:hypothetical protein